MQGRGKGRAGLGWAGLGWAVLGWAGLGWAGLGWAGLGWAGLGWAGESQRINVRVPWDHRSASGQKHHDPKSFLSVWLHPLTKLRIRDLD